MRDIQMNPANEATILQSLSTALREDLRRDIWRFALAYGYDGERVRVYTVAGGQWTGDETAYGNLYGLFLFGRPTRGFVDILGHAYGYSPLTISEDSTAAGGFQVRRGRYSPYVDLYTGFGVVDWPSVSLNRYQREVTVTPRPDLPAAVRDVYREFGGTRNRTRLVRLYGETLVRIMEENRDSMNWMVRPAAEVRSELQTRLEAEDPVVMSMMNLRRGVEGGRQAVRESDAQAVRDIYLELRKSSPDRERLEREYSRDLIDLVERNSVDLEWMMLPPERMSAEFTRRAQRQGTVEARIANEVQLTAISTQDQLTGSELKRLFEQNMIDVIVGATNAESRAGLSADRYDVLLGSHLSSPEGQRARSGTYYVLHSPVAERAEARGSLVIGDETDLDEWMRNGHEIGRGISRVEIGREGSDYKLTFSGDRRLRAFTAERVVGGISIPMRGSDYDNYVPGGNWTVGGLMHILQDHRMDLLGGAMYGTRQFGNERWDQWTVTLSGRLQGTNTATVSENWYGYIFFNSTNKQLVFASNDVFSNSDELRSVCQTLGGAQCTNLSELSRMTGGAGITWARADVITGDRLNLHLFFEGGAETYRRFSQPAEGQTPDRDRQFVFRAGAGLEYIRQSQQSVVPTIYSLQLGAQSGTWPLLPGEITRPEMLNPWATSIESGVPGWSLMLYGRVQW